MEQAVQEADGGGVLGQEPAPLGCRRPVGGHAESAAFVGGGDEPEQQLGAGVVEQGRTHKKGQDEVVAERFLDHAADGVVGQAAVGVSVRSAAVKYRSLQPDVAALMPSATRTSLTPMQAPDPTRHRFSPGVRSIPGTRGGPGCRPGMERADQSQLIEGPADGERGGANRVRAWWAETRRRRRERATALAGA